MPTLYHYTSTSHWPHIQKSGYLKVVDPEIEMLDSGTVPRVVHLTDEPNLKPSHPNAAWAKGAGVDKTSVRISVTIPSKDVVSWFGFAAYHNADPKWIESMSSGLGADGSHWYVVQRPIPSTEWGEVRINDVPVGKRELPRRQEKHTTPHFWRTSTGERAMCDFCGGENMNAAYRYECRVFTVGTWHNGSPESPGDADWAACWICADLIQKRDIPSLVARSQAGMIGEKVHPQGKHKTDSGFYNAGTSEERIRAFFKYYNKRRVFVGACDFCGVYGESVKWLYIAKPFTYKGLNSFGVDNMISGPEWAVCDTCSKLINKKRQKEITQRMVDRHISTTETQERRTLGPKERGLVKRYLPDWIAAFFKNWSGTSTVIPDVYVRPVVPQAPIAAQVALDEKYTLLHWLEGSEGRQYIGSWNDAYQGKGKSGRDATSGELMIWTQPLRHGEVFFWESNVAEEIRRAAIELAESDEFPVKLDPSMLPAPAGFFYSDTELGEVSGFPCRAIGWCVAQTIEVKKEKQINNISEVHVSMHPKSIGDPSQGEGIILTFWSNRPHDTVLRPSSQMVWQFRKDFRDTLNMHNADSKMDAQRPALFASMIAFIQQKIVIAGQGQPVSAATTKRIEREHPEHVATVRVVTLRRVQRADYERPDEPSGRTLSVQFWVPGFWRNQCFNPGGHKEAEKNGVGCNDHQSIRVIGHWRGPEDAPIKHTAGILYDVKQ